MSGPSKIRFKCLEVTQPIGTFYIGAINSRDLVYIAYSDIRKKAGRALEEYLGIERDLSPGRVSELKQYVNTIDATFPSSVILAVEPDKSEYDRDSGTMILVREEDVAKIIDGQHRIAGLEAFAGEEFDVNATIFVDMDMEDQAMVFATINLKQTKVSKSLAYDLYEYAVGRSPQKTCHNIAKLLNNKSDSPFRNKIKILGVATGKPEETLTQATFVDRLMKHISTDPMRDKDTLKRKNKLKPVTGKEKDRLIFRNFFIEDRDAVIAKNVANYFSAVASIWPQAWTMPPKGNILGRTTGFAALMRLLRPAYLKLSNDKEVVETSSFRSLLDEVQSRENDFTSDRFLPGSTGEGELYKEFLRQTGLSE
ncbi:MAG: DGQHR domain-containing protein [Candidatus Acidiferrales bacterium]